VDATVTKQNFIESLPTTNCGNYIKPPV